MSMKEIRQHNRKQLTIQGMFKTLLRWMHRTKKKILFCYKNTGVARTGAQWFNKEPCRVGIISAYGVIFFWQSCPTRGSHDMSLMRPVTGEPPPTPLMLCLYRSTASDLAPGARHPSAVLSGFCVLDREYRSVMFARPRSIHLMVHCTPARFTSPL